MVIWVFARLFYLKFAQRTCFQLQLVVCLLVWLFRGILCNLLYSVLGPIVGGYLSDPDDLFKGLIKYFPYLKRVPFSIPLIICGILCLLCTFITPYSQ